jgi:lysozyme
MLPGVDTHAGYGRINWKLVAESGVRFMWNKSAEGNEPAKDDQTWMRNCAEAQANGIAAGVYFFPYPLPYGDGKPAGRHPLEQAERFHRRVNGFGSRHGELSPVVDAEWPPPHEWAKWGCSAPQVAAWLREHCEAVALLFGRLPVIYTYPWFWAELTKRADVSWAGRYPLWMASYTHPGPGIPLPARHPPVPAPWRDWAAWQYSAEGSRERVPGIPACPVDRDVMRDEATLERLTGRVRLGPDDPTVPELEDPPSTPTTPDFAIVHSLDYVRGGDDDEPPDAA